MSVKRLLTVQTAFGLAHVGYINERVARLWLPDSHEKEARKSALDWAGNAPAIKEPGMAGRLVDYFNGRPVIFHDRVALFGKSDFALRVYDELRKIGWGKTITYGELAVRLGRPGAGRAVGMALGRNPIPVLIPCHRVIKADGAIGGFSAPGGPAMKAELLQLESGGALSDCQTG